MRLLLVAEQLRRSVPGGIGTYLQGLVQGLAPLGADGPEVTLWASRALPGRPDRVTELARSHPLGPGPATVRTSRLPGPGLVWGWDRGFGAWPAPADVLHAPSLAVPVTGDAPMTVMVHDLAWRRLPSCFTPRGRAWHEAALGRALARADLFLVPSRATADDLVAAGADSAQVEVVGEGSDHLPTPDHGGAAELLTRLDVRGRFLLSVSTLEPRKNLPRLVAAYQSARARFPEPWSLVVVGPTGWGQGLRGSEGVVAAGAVPSATLAALYERALAVAYVPLLEGFGLPALEAMRAGTPVVASPMPSTDGAAIGADPLDVDAISRALVLATTDVNVRSEAVEAGRLHAGRLTWEAAARRHVELWEHLS